MFLRKTLLISVALCLSFFKFCNANKPQLIDISPSSFLTTILVDDQLNWEYFPFSAEFRKMKRIISIKRLTSEPILLTTKTIFDYSENKEDGVDFDRFRACPEGKIGRYALRFEISYEDTKNVTQIRYFYMLYKADKEERVHNLLTSCGDDSSDDFLSNDIQSITEEKDYIIIRFADEGLYNESSPLVSSEENENPRRAEGCSFFRFFCGCFSQFR